MEEGGYPGYSYVLFRGDKRRTLLEEDMYVDKISMIFQVGSSRLHLTDHTNRAIFPEVTGHFATTRLEDRCHYEVHGDPAPTHTTGVPLAGQRRRPYSAAAAVPTEATQTSAGTPRAKRAKFPTEFFRAIFVSALVNGKLLCIRKLLIRIGEADANIEAITAKVKSEVGSDEPLVLLNSKGQEIADSEVTRCLSFWTSKARIISAMPTVEFLELQNGRMAKLSRMSVSEACVRAQNIILKIDEVKEAARSIPAITATVNQLSELTKIQNTVASLQGPMVEAFACPVCKDIMEVPMYATCCESFVGCRVCVQEWLLTANQMNCLMCREEDFAAKVHPVNGLDNVLSSLKDIGRV